MIFLVARNFREAHYYCQSIADPPVNPRGRDILILGSNDPEAEFKTRGRRFNEGDKIVYYGQYWDGRYMTSLRHALDYLKKVSQHVVEEEYV